MTLRDLYNLTAAARGHWVLCGTPQMEHRAERLRTRLEKRSKQGRLKAAPR